MALFVVSATPARSECTLPLLLGDAVPFLTGPNAHFMVAGDFNEDGRLDLAVTNGDLSSGSPNSSVAILMGAANGTYASPVLYSAGLGVRGIVARDFNEDGILDLAVSNKQSSTVSVLIGNGSGGVGNGTFGAAVHYTVGSGPFELVAEDFDRDGILDLATCLNGTQGVSVLRGLGGGGVGNGTFGGMTTFGLTVSSTGLASGDFNGDGITDLVVTQNSQGNVAMLLGTGLPTLGPGSFASPTVHSAGLEPFHVHVTDLNEDGKQDLAVASTNLGGVSIMLGLGNGSFVANGTLMSGNSSTVSTGDFNGDGILDVVTGTVTGSNSGHLELFLGQGAGGVGNGAFVSQGTYATQGDVYQVITGDFDQDGPLDALTAQGYGNFIELLSGVCDELPPDPRAPVITDVRDVPNDQGGRVFVTWTASSLDVTGGAVNSYRVWRRIPPAFESKAWQARLASREIILWPASKGTNAVVYWEALATLPAQRLEGYGYTAPTTQDSLPDSNPYTAFFVTALTADIDVFYSSAVDSGYSVDNLAPPQPSPFVAVYSPSGVELHWTPSVAPDFATFRLHRGSSLTFVPDASNLVATTADTGFVDHDPPLGAGCYKLAAVDIHGNVGRYATVSPSQPTAALISLVAARVGAEGVDLTWFVSAAPGEQVSVHRRRGDEDWQLLATVRVDGNGMARHLDATAEAGAEVGYRVTFMDAGIEVTGGEVWLDIPGAELALAGAVPNPVEGGMPVRFTLVDASPGRIEVLDVAGRLHASRDVGALGAGTHTLDLDPSRALKPGVYFLRLTQKGVELRARAVVLR